MKRYDELLERLFSSRAAGVKLGLERVRRCLDAMGRPDERIPVRVHVGGTNGKGSVCGFVEAIARAHGARTAVFSSPHLSRYAERFRIDGEPASEADILSAAAAVTDAGGDALTFFEQSTAIGVELFARAEVDIAIFEVGLGGRLDATTAIGHQIAAVTGVAFDHQSYLGDTLAQIAGEKAAIFRPGQRAVVGMSGEAEAVAFLVAGAHAAGVDPLVVVDAPVPADWSLGLAGDHQRANAACAVAVARQLAELGAIAQGDAVIRRGLAAARVAGRFETVAREPRVIVDCAHNPAGASALAIALGAVEHRPRVLVLAASTGKDVDGIAAALAPVVDRAIATRYARERAVDPAAVAAALSRARPGLPVTVAAGAREAIAAAREAAGPGGAVVVAGSVFVVGEAREALCGVVPDAIVLSDPM